MTPTIPYVVVLFPRVSSIVVLETRRTNISFSVMLTKVPSVAGNVAAGTLYCIGLGETLTPSSIGSVKSASFDKSSSVGTSIAIDGFSSYSSPSIVQLTGLTALQTYAIFCYAETIGGKGTNLTDIISVKAKAKTLCCKDITLTNAPVYVFGDFNKYSSSNPTSYLFKYTLSAAPTVPVKVTPQLYANGIMSNTVVSNPSSTIFSSTSILVGQFYLTASSSTSGQFSIFLTVTGIGPVEYSNATATTVQILSSFSAIPAPLMLSSRFTDSGQAVVILFDSSTDFANITASTWPCVKLFQFNNASLTTCTWVNSSSVSMTFGVLKNGVSNVVYLSIGDTVTLVPGILRAYCSGSSATCSQNPTAPLLKVLTFGPANPSPPTVVLNAPQSIGPCVNLTLDATGSYGNGGRLYTVIQWTVSASGLGSTTDPSSSIQDYLNSYSSAHQVYLPITIARRLPKASYTITLLLKNFFGLVSSSRIIVAVNGNPDLPNLTIFGPSYQKIFSSSPLTILSAGTLSSCASRTTAVKYTWTVQNIDRTVLKQYLSTNLDPTKFSLPAYSLMVDQTYIVNINASVGIFSTTASTMVYVAHGAVTAAVANGTSRSISVNEILNLDASISTDADQLPLTYQVFK